MERARPEEVWSTSDSMKEIYWSGTGNNQLDLERGRRGSKEQSTLVLFIEALYFPRN